MEKRILIVLAFIALLSLAVFLGPSITGWIVYKVEYNDMCKSDNDCPGEQCCFVYDDKSVGVCMEHCQSFEFLCKSSEECEEGTVCCISGGMEYGLCNYEDKCMSIELFGEYVKQVHRPAPVSNNTKIIVGTALLLIIILAWILLNKKKKK